MTGFEVETDARTTPEMLEQLGQYQAVPPVDVLGFAETLGLAVWEDELPPGVSGKLLKDSENGGKSGYSIVVNANEAYHRKRFTIAHEVAHFMLHRSLIKEVVDDTYYRSGLSNWREAEANRLAASILMPSSLIEDLRRQGVTTVEGLANRMEVSKQAIMVRLGIPIT